MIFKNSHGEEKFRETAMISISRPISDLDQYRKYSIFLNGEKIGNLNEGKTLEFRVGAGNYNLSAKIDWCTSNTIYFKAKPNEEYFFECMNNVPIFQSLLYITFYRKKYLLLKELASKIIYY